MPCLPSATSITSLPRHCSLFFSATIFDPFHSPSSTTRPILSSNPPSRPPLSFLHADSSSAVSILLLHLRAFLRPTSPFFHLTGHSLHTHAPCSLIVLSFSFHQPSSSLPLLYYPDYTLPHCFWPSCSAFSPLAFRFTRRLFFVSICTLLPHFTL